MARELGMNPKKLGKKDNQDQDAVEDTVRAVHRAHLQQAVRQGAPGCSSVVRKGSAATRRRRLGGARRSCRPGGSRRSKRYDPVDFLVFAHRIGRKRMIEADGVARSRLPPAALFPGLLGANTKTAVQAGDGRSGRMRRGGRW